MFCSHRADSAEDRAAVTVSHALMLHAVGGSKKTRAIPKQLAPDMIELEYGRSLVGIVGRLRPIYEPVMLDIGRAIAALPSRSDDDRSDADPFAQRLLEQVREKGKGVISNAEAKRLATFYGSRLSIQQREQLARQIRAGLGVDVPISESSQPALIDMFAEDNAAMIGSIPTDLHQDFAKLAVRAYVKRMSVDTFSQEIQNRFDVAEGKARFLALDQIGSLHGQLNAARQRELGINHYIWATRRDENVRPLHEKRDGKRFAFDSPPAGGLPGEDYGCRCQAIPDLTKIIAAIKKARDQG